MIRMIFAACVLLGTGLSAGAQDTGAGGGGPASSTGAGTSGGNVSGSGKTMPMPGASKGEGTTSLDRGVQQKDNDIQGSVCKGC